VTTVKTYVVVHTSIDGIFFSSLGMDALSVAFPILVVNSQC